MALHTITISVNDDRVRCSPDPLEARFADEIEFECADGPFAVHFQSETPFPRQRHRARKSEKARDKVDKKVEERTTYKYFVAVTKGEEVFTEDPKIVIDP